MGDVRKACKRGLGLKARRDPDTIETRIAISAALALCAVAMHAADGTVVFRNSSPVNAPVFRSDIAARLSGSAWLAQLYYCASGTGEYQAAAGDSAPFREGAGAGF